MNYFGTNLRDHGHFMWILEGEYLERSRIYYENAPFDPERLPFPNKDNVRIKGNVQFYHAFGYSIVAIEGSCKDGRPGTKSIFWTKEIISFGDMKAKLFNIPIALKIFNSMPFEVKWHDVEGDV